MFNPVLRTLSQSIFSGKIILATSQESRPFLVRHKPDVQPWLEISDLESRTIVHAAKTKKPISCAMSAHLVCVPVFLFAKSKFSHGCLLNPLFYGRLFALYIISMFFKPTTQKVVVVSRVLFNSSYHFFSVKVTLIFKTYVKV